MLFLGQNRLYGGTVDAAFVGYLLRSATGLAALLLLLAAGIIVVAEALRTSSDRPPRRRAASVATSLALALGLGLGAVIGVATPVLNPLTPDVATAPTLTAPAGMIESIWYQGFVAPEAHRQVQAAIRPYVALGPNAAPSAITSTVRDSVLPELVKVRSSMAGLSASDPAVLAAHQHLTTALDGFIDAFGRVAENGDSAAGRDALSAATLEWNAWLQAVAAL